MYESLYRYHLESWSAGIKQFLEGLMNEKSLVNLTRERNRLLFKWEAAKISNRPSPRGSQWESYQFFVVPAQ